MHAIVDGLRIAYLRSSHTVGTPTVLLHALGETGGDWRDVAKALAPYGTVIVPDLRGHGGSAWSGDYAFEAMRNDVLGLLDALQLPVVDLIGHSLGGAVAALVASEAPGRVRRLVLEEPPPPLACEPRRGLPPRPEGDRPFDWSVVRAVTAQRNDPDNAWWTGLKAITASTLIIAGGETSHLPQDQLVDMARQIPHARLVTIPVGHEVHARDLAGFLAEVQPFLRPRLGSR